MIPIIRRYSTKAITVNESFKSTMSRISAQAMILTSGTGAKEVLALHGMTMSSVCSLSVYPTPLLQFNLHLPSYTSQALHENKYLAIHLLPPTSQSVHLGKIFASGVKTSGKPTTNEDGEFFHEMTTPFTKLHQGNDWIFHTVKENINIPILKNSERVLICETMKNFLVDDHEIWVVKVLDIKENEDYSNKTGGLLYFDRAFHKIGEKLIETN
ncbi:putative NADH-dependent oxidoreductase [Suhomyces tanzawaensis NRRL Y-17324]|uniref:Putative NADH-dependent oxidoreductase n=1 Tax=Suhomyces tanzawaensis NRRL Y-17324 TaxID=984487 RepID=A0A1E4SJJ4_9ASCO|nr:putative NADH-dependent oxidoreductase [Suhomyces tanzawaensis NRRL Y-17324]ODV79685.1 putative NADH-dependent oxidoreductase [Suhomyces tanzawaensis NRRL Y-17324]